MNSGSGLVREWISKAREVAKSKKDEVLILSLSPDDADEIASQLAACSDDYESLPEYSKKFYDKLREFAG